MAHYTCQLLYIKYNFFVHSIKRIIAIEKDQLYYNQRL